MIGDTKILHPQFSVLISSWCLAEPVPGFADKFFEWEATDDQLSLRCLQLPQGLCPSLKFFEIVECHNVRL